MLTDGAGQLVQGDAKTLGRDGILAGDPLNNFKDVSFSSR